MNQSAYIAIIIFLIVIICIATEKVNRTLAAMAGALVMFLLGILSPEEAVTAIDFNTLGVLIGMMLVVGTVKRCGLFEYTAIRTAQFVKGNPVKLMIGFAIITAFLSAILDNVTTVLLVGPMTLVITDLLQISPLPFLITEIISSNIGGTSTLIGDPPNIMIGSAAGLSFLDFVIHLLPVVIIILAITLALLYVIYRKALVISYEHQQAVLTLNVKKAITNYPLLYKSLVILGLILLGFIFHDRLGITSSSVALTGATLILLISHEDVEEIFASVEWLTIGFFTALFVLVGGLEATGVINLLASYLLNVTSGNNALMLLSILWLSAIVSSFLDNIPFVATLIPLIIALGDSGIYIQPLWWAVSLGACLGGNGTLIGASANLVLANISARHGQKISFGYYFKIGFPLMLLSIAISTAYLFILYV